MAASSRRSPRRIRRIDDHGRGKPSSVISAIQGRKCLFFGKVLEVTPQPASSLSHLLPREKERIIFPLLWGEGVGRVPKGAPRFAGCRGEGSPWLRLCRSVRSVVNLVHPQADPSNGGPGPPLSCRPIYFLTKPSFVCILREKAVTRDEKSPDAKYGRVLPVPFRSAGRIPQQQKVRNRAWPWPRKIRLLRGICG